MPMNPLDQLSLECTILETSTLTIESVAYGGAGVARCDGKVFFVENSVEGDIVEVRAVVERKRYVEAALERIVQPSPLRGPSPCPYSGQCGGCDWQGVDYAAQLRWKADFVASALRRIGGAVELPRVQMTPSPNIQGYRSRVHLRARLLAGRLKVGYFKRGSHEFTAVDRCAIADEVINAFVMRAAKHTFSQPEAAFRMEIHRDLADDAGVRIVLFPGETEATILDTIAADLSRIGGVIWVGDQAAARHAEPFVFDRVVVPADEGPGKEIFSNPGQFQQVNIELNRKLRSLVHDLVMGVNPRRVLDLFCGSGNLSLGLVGKVERLVGVEKDLVAIQNARRGALGQAVAATAVDESDEEATATAPGDKSVTYIAGDVVAHLWAAAKSAREYDVVILDPPRQGVYPGIPPLQRLNPRRIIYVSCDPATLARDLGRLLRTYQLSDAYAFDFFPNTFHIETVAVLDRKA